MKEEEEMIQRGGVGVVPTDTIYGIIASALSEFAVTRVCELKGRTSQKKWIILISSLDDLNTFGVTLNEEQRKVIDGLWPGPVSIVLPCSDTAPEYLRDENGTVAFRLPDDAKLVSFLKESGPCIAPSANPEESPHAKTIEEAKKYFCDKVDFYIDGGELSGMASTLISLDEYGSIKVLRQGSKQVV